MIEKLIRYFSDKHLISNMIIVGIFVGAVFVWQNINKEHMPNIAFGRVAVFVNFPGASATEVEFFIGRPLEEALQSLAGIDKITTTCNDGSCRVNLDIDPNVEGYDKLVSDIRTAALGVSMPSGVKDDPVIREFRPSEFPVMNLALMHTNNRVMNQADREELQRYADLFQDLLEALPEVIEAEISGYLENQVHVRVKPDKLENYQLSFDQVLSAVQNANVRAPVGSLATKTEEKLTIDSELNTIDEIMDVPLLTSFSAAGALRLKDVASGAMEFEEQKTLMKFNGYEGLRLVITKSQNYDVIEVSDRVRALISEFESRYLAGKPVRVRVLSDSSSETRNRLNMIASNGILGFVLVLIMLLLFLSFETSFWVAAGIPFSLAFALLIAPALGLTVNSMTLAAVIIVMGMIVDDAIVIAENIERRRREKKESEQESSILGTAEMFLPVLGSVVTTCVAFVALYFFGGRFGRFAQVMPPVIFLILGGSLIESILFLPGHMKIHFPRIVRAILSLGIIPLYEYLMNRRKKGGAVKVKAHDDSGRHWFDRVEDFYEKILGTVLKFKWAALGAFVVLMVFSMWIFNTKMKFVMFPSSETTQVNLRGSAPAGTPMMKTAALTESIEDVLREYMGKEVISFTTYVAVSRFGSAVNENEFNIQVELVTADKREKSSDQLVEEWTKRLEPSSIGLDELVFMKSRFGQSSGRSIELEVGLNSNEERDQLISILSNTMQKDPWLTNIEIQQQKNVTEYRIVLRRLALKKLNVPPESVTTALRAVLQGVTAFTIVRDDDEIDVLINSEAGFDKDLNRLMELPVRNSQGYLVRLKQLVDVDRVISKDAIKRVSSKRVAYVYADIAGIKKTDSGQMAGRPGGIPNLDKLTPAEKAQIKKRMKLDPDKPEELAKLKKIMAARQAQTRPDKAVSQPLSTAAVSLTGTNQRPRGIPTPLDVADYYEKEIFPQAAALFSQVSLKFTGEIEDTRESRSDIIFGFLLVLLMIYAVLAALFNSLSRPLIIMLAIPFGIIGVILAFWLHQKTQIGFFTGIGLIGLAGVVVNDSIVMVVKLDQNFDHSDRSMHNRHKIAAIAKTRLRAIILTTVTTVAGLMPTAYGIGGYDDFVSDMMLAMAWGLLFATLITLFLIPGLYSVLLDIRDFLKGRHQEKKI